MKRNGLKSKGVTGPYREYTSNHTAFRSRLLVLPAFLSAIPTALAQNCWFFVSKDCELCVFVLPGEQWHSFHFLWASLQKDNVPEVPTTN